MDGRSRCPALRAGHPAAIIGGRRLLLWRLLATGLVAATLLHFGLLLLGLIPLSGIPPGLRSVASGYATPIFVQTWWLFAPDPPAIERAVEVRGFYLSRGDSQETPWLSLTEPVIRAVQQNRLSSQNAAWTALLYAQQSLTSQTPLLSVGPEIRERLIASWDEPAHQPATVVALERAGSAALAAEYPELQLEQVQVRLTLRRMPPFGGGGEEAGPLEVIVFRPVPFQSVTAWSPGR